MIVLDTHVLVWWVADDGKVSRKAMTAIRRELTKDSVGVSAISAWEIGMLVAKGRLALNMDVDVWLKTVSSIPGLRFLPLTSREAIDSTRLPEAFRGDPADRMIVATARAENAPLVTADRKIRAYPHVQSIW